MSLINAVVFLTVIWIKQWQHNCFIYLCFRHQLFGSCLSFTSFMYQKVCLAYEQIMIIKISGNLKHFVFSVCSALRDCLTVCHECSASQGIISYLVIIPTERCVCMCVCEWLRQIWTLICCHKWKECLKIPCCVYVVPHMAWKSSLTL